MDKYMNIPHLLGLVILLSLTSLTQVYAIGNDEWLDIDMEFQSTNGELLITCTKDIDVSFDMLMTVIDYDTKERLSVLSSSHPIILDIITLDDSMIQVFCEYTESNGDKAGYAIMRTFTP